MKNQKGFSLIELLVVVIIIAIIAAIAIPNLLASRRAANEASAVQSLRTIHSAQVTYQATVGGTTEYGTITNLGATDQGLIDAALEAAVDATTAKSGYFYTLTLGEVNESYCTLAEPSSATTGGIRTFAVSSDGVVYSANADNTVPATCTGTDPIVAGGDHALGGVAAAP